MATEAQRRASRKYRSEKCSQVNVVFYPTDADIAEWLGGFDNKSGHIKELLRKEMEGA